MLKKYALILIYFCLWKCDVNGQLKGVATVMDAQGTVLNVKRLLTNVIIRNAIIEASPFMQIFDSSVVLENCKAKEFSTAWFGANRNIPDNSAYLKRASDACISNNITNLFIADSYTYSQSWSLSNIYKAQYVGFALNVYGQGGMWSDKTTLTYTGNSFAFGVQMAKGGSIRNVRILGNYAPVVFKESSYYTATFPTKPAHYGIAVDYDGSKNTGGSSGYTIENTWVDGFDVLYAISPNGVTTNCDMIRLNNIRCGNGRIGVQSNQAQEKGNEINYISCWSYLHTLIQIGQTGKKQAGQYTVRGGNIAGYVVQLFDVSLSGWNGFYVEGLSVENIGRIGTILAKTTNYNPICIIKNSTIRFALKPAAGDQVLFSSNSVKVTLKDCNLWYYGGDSPMKYSGVFTFDNCDFGKSTYVKGTILEK